jgi:hypothetical protein
MPVKRSYQAVLDWQEESRRAFGKMLLNWRRRNGWTQYTACEWGTEAGFEVISYGNLSVIEQGKAGELRQKAFFQLEELNRRLDEKDWGEVKAQRIKDLLKDAEPLRGDDDKLWDAVDFWSCYIGYVRVPKAFQSAPAPTLTARRAEELCQKWRQQVRRAVKERGLDAMEALEAVMTTAPKEQQKRFREVLTGFDDYSSVELAQLWLEGEDFLPLQWIESWESGNPPEPGPTAAPSRRRK